MKNRARLAEARGAVDRLQALANRKRRLWTYWVLVVSAGAASGFLAVLFFMA